MELNVEDFEIDDLNDELKFNLDKLDSSFYEEIPENVVVRKVQFNEPMRPLMQQIPKENARVVRPYNPKPKPQISYDDILLKMGMFVSEGKLHLIGNSVGSQEISGNVPQEFSRNVPQEFSGNIPQNSYIYNKYFKEQLQNDTYIQKPKTKHEYKMMLLQQILQKQRIKQMKSTKLIMPTTNINISSGRSSTNLNKLFTFPKK